MKEIGTLSKKNEHTVKQSNKVLLPIIIMMGFIPLIVHMYVYNCNLSQFEWFSANADRQSDFFFAWKMIAIVAVAIVMIGILLYQALKKNKKMEFRLENSFYFLFLYAMFVGMSALFSGYKYWVVRGTFELFESVWVVFAYILLCYYTYQFVQNERQVKFILGAAGIGMTIVTLIGVFQYFKLDFFKTDFGKHLILNPSWWSNLEALNFNMLEGTSYTTLYNPNFLSFYFGMLVPLLVCLFVASRKIWQKLLLAVAEILCLICLKGSGSDTGWMAIVIGASIIALVLASRRKKIFYTVLGIGVTGMVLIILLGMKTDVGVRIKDSIVGTYHYNEQFALRSVETGEDNVMLDFRGNKLYLSYITDAEGNALSTVMDENGQELELVLTDETNHYYVLSDSRFEGMGIQSVKLGENEVPAVAVWSDGLTWNFVNLGGVYYYCNTAGKAVEFPNVKNISLLREDAMSFRGHIWNMTIPLLGKHVFMGSGANTYMFEYPQNDYLGQVYIYGGSSLEVKAHCWYLQQWVETGLIGTLALLAFLGWYVIRSMRIYRRADLHESISWVGFGLFAAVLVYLIAAIANDSNVCTAPMFWGMLGLGLATNRMIVEKEKLFAQQVDTAVVDEVQTDMTEAVSSKESVKEAEAVRPKQTSSKKQTRKQRKNHKK